MSGMSEKLDALSLKEEILAAIDDLEDHFDAFDEVEQEIVERLIGHLNHRLFAFLETLRE